MCKILERILKEQLVKYLEDNNFKRDSQNEFWKGKSCLTNLLELMETVTELAEEGDIVDIIYSDFQNNSSIAQKKLVVGLIY